jgi:hypothetical protein
VTKRKTSLDKAIDRIDQAIAQHQAHIKALELARQHLVAQQHVDVNHANDGPVVVDRSLAHQRGVS